ncbi:MAG: polysaccharide deacetylase family protein [Planctomycetota bacterium]|jgi:peptidoglycan/xylan/chitin deacetylase (PgdA/CDA1 family)
MSKFHVTSIAALALAGAAAWFLEGSARWAALGAVAAAWVALVAVGVCVLRLGFFCRVHSRGRAGSGEVALTFDDGPDPASTPALLDALARKGVRAAFFCVGSRVDLEPELVRRIAAEGHLVCNHTHSHSGLTNLFTTRRVVAEIVMASDAVERAAGARPRFFRPPVGLTNPNVASAARQLGLDVIAWRCGLFDRGSKPAQSVVDRVLRALRERDIVALHDQGVAPERLVAVAEGVIDGARRKGLDFERLDVLIGRQAYEEGGR